MKYSSVSEIATKWEITERAVRKYCAEGRVAGAILQGKTWLIPENAVKPARKKREDATPKTLLDILVEEKNAKLHGGIYHKVQIELTYNSNHIEGSRLTHDQTDTFMKPIPQVLPIKLSEWMTLLKQRIILDVQITSQIKQILA